MPKRAPRERQGERRHRAKTVEVEPGMRAESVKGLRGRLMGVETSNSPIA